VALRCADILEKQNVEFSIDDLDAVVAAGYPDIRKTITLLEQFSTTGKLTVGSAEQVADWKLGLLADIESGDFLAARRTVCNSATKEELIDVFKFLYDNVEKIGAGGALKKALHAKNSADGKYDAAIVLIAQYMFQHAFASDPEINVAALFVELSQLFRKTNQS